MARVLTPAALRERLDELGRERERNIEATAELKRQIGGVLTDVQETPGITLTEAATLLGVTRPYAHQLLKAGGPADDMARADGLGA